MTSSSARELGKSQGWTALVRLEAQLLRLMCIDWDKASDQERVFAKIMVERKGKLSLRFW